MRKMVIGLIVFCILLAVVIMGYAKDLVRGDLVNILSLVAALAILVITIAVAMKYINQMKNDKSKGVLAEENWDGIGEYKNEVPSGWAISYILVIIWAIWYMQPFVELGNYGTKSFSQIGQWNEEVLAHKKQYENKWANADKDTLINMGESIFLVQCAPCHGVDASGINGKARDLTNWGNEKHVRDVIVNGSSGINGYGGMPGGLVSNDEDIDAIVAYVMQKISLAKKTSHPELVSKGEELFNNNCSACHGPDGAGIEGVGINLASLATAAIKNGKKGNIGTMPSFNSMLTDVQVKALNEYIYSLNN